MKLLVIALVLYSSLSYASATKETAILECNATNPVQKNPCSTIALAHTAFKLAKLSQGEKCFLYCFLEKVGFLDENADLHNVEEIIEFTLREAPHLEEHGVEPILRLQTFVVKEWTSRELVSKCEKAFVVFTKFTECIFLLEFAYEEMYNPGLVEKFIRFVHTNQTMDHDFTERFKQYLEFVELITSSLMETVVELSVQPKRIEF